MKNKLILILWCLALMSNVSAQQFDVCVGTPTQDCSQFDGDEGSCIVYNECSWNDPDCTGTLTCEAQPSQVICEGLSGCVWRDYYLDGVFQPFLVGVNDTFVFGDVRVDVFAVGGGNERLATELFTDPTLSNKKVVYLKNFTDTTFEYNKVYNASAWVDAPNVGWVHLHNDVPTYVGRSLPSGGSEVDPIFVASNSSIWSAINGKTSYSYVILNWYNKTQSDLRYLQTETDPQVGTLTNTKWCTSDGSQVICNTDAPVLTETDPQVNTLTNGKWCTSNGTVVNCATDPPLTSETDPQVDTVTSGNFCKGTGTTVSCTDSSTYLTAETDPKISTLTSTKWCTSNGTHILCTTNAPVLSEVDPKVGTLTNTKWCTTDGSQVICNSDAPSGSETDPIYNANLYAVGMNQYVDDEADVQFNSVTDGVLDIEDGNILNIEHLGIRTAINGYGDNALDMNIRGIYNISNLHGKSSLYASVGNQTLIEMLIDRINIFKNLNVNANITGQYLFGNGTYITDIQGNPAMPYWYNGTKGITSNNSILGGRVYIGNQTRIKSETDTALVIESNDYQISNYDMGATYGMSAKDPNRDILYVDYSGTVKVFDISIPDNPVLMTSFGGLSSPLLFRFDPKTNQLMILSQTHIMSVDVTNPYSPSVNSCQVYSGQANSASEMDDTYYYVLVPSPKILRIMNRGCGVVEDIPTATGYAFTVNVNEDSSRLYLHEGVGLNKLKIYDITDIDDPVLISSTDVTGDGLWRNGMYKDGYIYTWAEGSEKFRIWDVSDDENPFLQTDIGDSSQVYYGGTLSGNYVTYFRSSGGPYSNPVFDISTPTNPVRFFIDTSQPCTPTVGDDKYVCIYDHLEVYDLKNLGKTQTKPLAQFGKAGVNKDSQFIGDGSLLTGINAGFDIGTDVVFGNYVEPSDTSSDIRLDHSQKLLFHDGDYPTNEVSIGEDSGMLVLTGDGNTGVKLTGGDIDLNGNDLLLNGGYGSSGGTINMDGGIIQLNSGYIRDTSQSTWLNLYPYGNEWYLTGCGTDCLSLSGNIDMNYYDINEVDQISMNPSGYGIDTPYIGYTYYGSGNALYWSSNQYTNYYNIDMPSGSYIRDGYAGYNSIDPYNRHLIDNGGSYVSIDYSDRQLRDSSGYDVLTYSSYTAPKFNGLTSNGVLMTSNSDGTITETVGVTDSSSYWLCTASDCSSSCQVAMTNGIITGCT